MLITRETDYALRVLRSLSDGQMHTVGEIAEVQMIPKQFAYKIIKKLNQARIIDILRGASGGCRLAADLKTVTLYDLLIAIEDQLSISACLESGYHCAWQECNRSCTIHCELARIQRKLDEELRSHSLASLLSV